MIISFLFGFMFGGFVGMIIACLVIQGSERDKMNER